MIYGNLKKSLRLNRTIALSYLFYSGLWYLLGEPISIPLAIATGVAVVFFAMNEIWRRLLSGVQEVDSRALEKQTVFCAMMLFTVSALVYLFRGGLMEACFMLFPILQAQLFGHYKLSRIFLGAIGILMLASIPFGHPHVPGSELSPLSTMMLILPLGLCLFHYGAFVASMVRNSTSQVHWLQSLATTDGLTGLINRRQFNHRLQGEVSRARRHKTPLSLALFDIDNFKHINDTYGHPVGDRILKELGQLILDNIRDSDIGARYGGEEFSLILPETRQIEAIELLERLRVLVAGTVFCLPDNPMTLTISIGVAQLDLDHHTAFELVEQADAALYEAKKQGKNRVIYGAVPTPKVNASAPSFNLNQP